ncbi:CheR family methyltransferase [Caldimonas tepidiphila]|uniref:CheR family methyltransferase n=1 Tax=Caldimonas tepidiphila TaxID=2315841 RepID=UPI000E5BA5C7|nr:CheR family methyltransferase [Caldimonas tepidiphila]
MTLLSSPLQAPAEPGIDPRTQEFSFEPADFERVRRLIHQHAGISLHEGKQAMVYSRLSRRLRETRHRSIGAYLQWLEQAHGAQAEAEWQEFVNCLTTNLTAFFREEHHFELLAQELRLRGGRAPLRIWCNAASTGEEPYSLAMTVAETLGADAPVRIVASDIDTRVLETARRGVYTDDARGLSPERLKRHFLRGTGTNAGRIRIKPELARLIEFRHFNLMASAWSLGDPFDLVFCRNVMIYFDAPTQRRVLERIHGVMKPEGVLFVGHSENFTDARELFQLRGKTVYQRVGPARGASAAPDRSLPR